jgi:thioredoxin 1
MDVEGIGVTLTDQNFQTLVLESEQPVLVAFWAEGCGPWHLLAPDIAALGEAFRGQAAVATLDVEAEPQTPERYGIQTIPAVLFFQNGQVVDQLTGMVDKADMAAKLRPSGTVSVIDVDLQCPLIVYTDLDTSWCKLLG